MRTLDDYRAMLLIRRFEEKALELHAAGEIQGSMHLCCGQEAIAVGACQALEDRDCVTATYRGHGWALARGIPPLDIFAELLGRDSALCGGRGGSAYFSSARHGFLGENSIVGAGVPIAAGAALAARQDAGGAVSLVVIGDGALNQGSVHEALNFAAVEALPLVVVVENNRYSEMTPIVDMVRVATLSERSSAYGIPGKTVDGQSVLSVFTAVSEAVDHARTGSGPSIVEAECERLVGHYTGDIQHYRPAREVEEATAREPLVRLRADHPELADAFAGIAEEVELQLDRAITDARSVPYPSPASVADHLYRSAP
jgi:TPP-dependent pyruvate/acetoin dehydrogenase alpha subunit